MLNMISSTTDQARTGKQEAQFSSIVFPFVCFEPENIKGRNIAPEVLLSSKLPPDPTSDECWCPILQNPIGVPRLLAQGAFTVCFMARPVRLLAA